VDTTIIYFNKLNVYMFMQFLQCWWSTIRQLLTHISGGNIHMYTHPLPTPESQVYFPLAGQCGCFTL